MRCQYLNLQIPHEKRQKTTYREKKGQKYTKERGKSGSNKEAAKLVTPDQTWHQ